MLISSYLGCTSQITLQEPVAGVGGVGVLGWIERGEQVPGKTGQEWKEHHVVAQCGALDMKQRS